MLSSGKQNKTKKAQTYRSFSLHVPNQACSEVRKEQFSFLLISLEPVVALGMFLCFLDLF